jgi:hypothetical protein
MLGTRIVAVRLFLSRFAGTSVTARTEHLLLIRAAASSNGRANLTRTAPLYAGKAVKRRYREEWKD